MNQQYKHKQHKIETPRRAKAKDVEGSCERVNMTAERDMKIMADVLLA
jgi:hypothetical protein